MYDISFTSDEINLLIALLLHQVDTLNNLVPDIPYALVEKSFVMIDSLYEKLNQYILMLKETE